MNAFLLAGLICLGFLIKLINLLISSWGISRRAWLKILATIPVCFLGLAGIFSKTLNEDSKELIVIILVAILLIWFASFKVIILPKVSKFLVLFAFLSLLLNLVYEFNQENGWFFISLALILLAYGSYVFLSANTVLREYVFYLLLTIIIAGVIAYPTALLALFNLTLNEPISLEFGLTIILVASYTVYPLLYATYLLNLSRGKREPIDEFQNRLKIEENVLDKNYYHSKRLTKLELMTIFILMTLQLFLVKELKYNSIFIWSLFLFMAEMINDVIVEIKRRLLLKNLVVSGNFIRDAGIFLLKAKQEDLFNQQELLTALKLLQQKYFDQGKTIDDAAVKKVQSAFITE